VSTRRRRMRVLGGGGGVDLMGYLQSLGAFLLYDGTLNGSALKNLGSGGATYDAALTDVTIDEDGMHFNGTTSIATITRTATLAGFTDHEWLTVWNATTLGESSAGALAQWGTLDYHLRLLSNNRLITRVPHATSFAQAITANNAIDLETWTTIFKSYNATSKVVRIHKNVNGTVTDISGTPTAGTGDFSVPAAGNNLTIGNNAGLANTFDGAIKYVAVFSRQLTSDERSAIVALMPPFNPARSTVKSFLAFGDSTAMGSMDTALPLGTGGYPPLLVQLLNDAQVAERWYELTPRQGYSGTTTALQAAAIAGELEDVTGTPDVIFYGLGANDTDSALDENTWKANTRTILRAFAAKWADVPIYIWRPYRTGTIGTALDTYAGWIADIVAEEEFAPYVSLGVDCRVILPGLMADDKHPNHTGYLALATAMKTLLGY
jgi:lysophospholipase L1-like esterase